MDQAPSCLDAGVYYGWACVDRGAVHKMVMSLGWNPHYQNEKKSMVGSVADPGSGGGGGGGGGAQWKVWL